jgi:hypothetical protein
MTWSPDMLKGLPPIDRWRQTVGMHLDLIAVGASMVTRHTRQLPLRPPWESKAEAGLVEAADALEATLATVRAALKAYQNKPVDGRS